AFSAQQSEPISVYYVPLQYVLEDKHLTAPDGQQGFIYNNSTYIPLRFIAYALRKSVTWDPDTYTVAVGEPGLLEKIKIARYMTERQVQEPGKEVTPSDNEIAVAATSIDVYKEQVTYVFSGEMKQPDAALPGFIYDSTLYVPLRFFSESL